jgi:hypothetical protein
LNYGASKKRRREMFSAAFHLVRPVGLEPTTNGL